MTWSLRWGEWIIDELLHCGVSCFCISPGSRSTPLTVAVARNPKIELSSKCINSVHRKAKSVLIYDERAAAYYALGHARATGEPAVLICTSGTAVANYWPAVVEASIEQIPMLLLTADRPPELRETGANQSIDQIKMFGSHIRWFFDPGCAGPEFKHKTLLSTIDQAVYRTQHPLPGPVHLNFPFREPFFSEENSIKASDDAFLNSENSDNENKVERNVAYVEHFAPVKFPSEAQIEHLVENRSIRGILSIGRIPTVSLSSVKKLAESLGWPVFADITSGFRLGKNCSNRVSYYDAMLLDGLPFKEMECDEIWHIGFPPTSKRWLTYWEQNPVKQMVWFTQQSERQDQSHHFTKRIEADILVLCEKLIHKINQSKSNKENSSINNFSKNTQLWKQKWVDASQKIGKELSLHFNGKIQSQTLDEFSIVRKLTELIPEQHAFFIGNSMPVRLVDMVGTDQAAEVPTALNRGASGIDGQIATACGYALGMKRPVTLLLGDLTALHDLNSFQLIADSREPVICIILNNHGGGIFSYLPVAKETDVFEDFFGTPHSLEFKKIAEMFALHYEQPDSMQAFETNYSKAIQTNKSVVLELFTNRESNPKHLKTWQARIRKLYANEGSI